MQVSLNLGNAMLFGVEVEPKTLTRELFLAQAGLNKAQAGLNKAQAGLNKAQAAHSTFKLELVVS